MNYNAYPYGRWIKWGIIALVAVIILFAGIGNYNGLVQSEQNVDQMWSQVENQMQRRADVINNLVGVVKGYTKHEAEVFGDIADARAVIASQGADINSKLKADETLTAATRGIFTYVENYPDLKANEQFQMLSEEIAGSENRVAVARRDFIQSVNSYNKKIKTFPANIFAKAMGFDAKEYYKASPGAEKSPTVEF